MYSIKEICRILDIQTEMTDKQIRKVCYFENQIIPDCAYFCIKGETFDTHNVKLDVLKKILDQLH